MLCITASSVLKRFVLGQRSNGNPVSAVDLVVRDRVDDYRRGLAGDEKEVASPQRGNVGSQCRDLPRIPDGDAGTQTQARSASMLTLEHHVITAGFKGWQ